MLTYDTACAFIDHIAHHALAIGLGTPLYVCRGYGCGMVLAIAFFNNAHIVRFSGQINVGFV